MAGGAAVALVGGGGATVGQPLPVERQQATFLCTSQDSESPFAQSYVVVVAAVVFVAGGVVMGSCADIRAGMGAAGAGAGTADELVLMQPFWSCLQHHSRFPGDHLLSVPRLQSYLSFITNFFGTGGAGGGRVVPIIAGAPAATTGRGTGQVVVVVWVVVSFPLSSITRNGAARSAITIGIRPRMQHMQLPADCCGKVLYSPAPWPTYL